MLNIPVESNPNDAFLIHFRVGRQRPDSTLEKNCIIDIQTIDILMSDVVENFKRSELLVKILECLFKTQRKMSNTLIYESLIGYKREETIIGAND